MGVYICTKTGCDQRIKFTDRSGTETICMTCEKSFYSSYQEENFRPGWIILLGVVAVFLIGLLVMKLGDIDNLTLSNNTPSQSEKEITLPKIKADEIEKKIGENKFTLDDIIFSGHELENSNDSIAIYNEIESLRDRLNFLSKDLSRKDKETYLKGKSDFYCNMQPNITIHQKEKSPINFDGITNIAAFDYYQKRLYPIKVKLKKEQNNTSLCIERLHFWLK